MTIAAPIVMSRTLYKDFSGRFVHHPEDLPEDVFDAVSSVLSGIDISKGAVSSVLCSYGDCVVAGYAGAFGDISEGMVGMDMFEKVGARQNLCFAGFCIREIDSETRFPSRGICSKMYGWLMLDLWEDDSEGPIPSIISDYRDYDSGIQDEDGYIDLMECYHHTENNKRLMLITNSSPKDGQGFTEVRNIQDIIDPIPERKGQKVGFLKSDRVLTCIDGEELAIYEKDISDEGPSMVSIYKVPGGKIRVISASIPDADDELPQECLITGAGPFGSRKPLPVSIFATLRDDVFGIVPNDNVKVIRKKVKRFKGGH